MARRILLRLAVVVVAVGAVLAALLTPALLVLPSDAAESPSADHQMPRFLPFLGQASVHCTQGNPVGPAGSGCGADPTLGRPVYHPFPAVDFRLPPGAPVRATGSGVVVTVAQDTGDEAFEDADGADYNGLRGAGLFAVIRHEEGEEQRLSVYKHLAEAVVADGDWVEAGQIVGLVGRSEATGLHLHYDEQASMDRFQFEDNRLPLSALGGECEAITDWEGPSGIPKGTLVPLPGWSCGNDFHGREPIDAASEDELRAALDELAVADGAGPFTIRLTADDRPIVLDDGPLRWEGSGLLVLDGDADDDGARATVRNPEGRVLESTSAQAVELRTVVLRAGGPVEGSGGVVEAAGPLSVVESIVRGGDADGDGGGLASDQSVALVRTWVDDNRAEGSGGGIHAPVVVVTESTLSHNRAGGSGGAVAVDRSARLSNSTVSTNRADGGVGGVTGPDLDLQHSTFAANEGSTVASVDAESVHALGVSFDARPGVENCRTVTVVAPAWPAVNQDSGSSCQGTSAPDGWLEDTDARLGRLMAHTGWTPTHFPLRGSPLIDAYGPLPAEIGGTSLGCSASTSIDQRGSALPTDAPVNPRDDAPPSERLARTWEARLGVDLRTPCDIGAVTAAYPAQDWVGLPAGHLSKAAAWWASSPERAVGPGEDGVRLLEVDERTGDDGALDWEDSGGVLRQELARLLYVFTGRPEVDHEHGFTDTPDWMDDLLDWLDAPYGAAGRAIMAGRNDTTFDPDGLASRHQAAVVLWRLAGQPGPRGDAQALGEETPSWARDAVAWATADPPGPATAVLPPRTAFGQPTFSGASPINRSELAAAVYALARSCEAWNPVGPGGAGVAYPVEGTFFAEPCR